MLVLCFMVHQPHSVSVCLFLVRGPLQESHCRVGFGARRPQGATPQRLLTHHDNPSHCRRVSGVRVRP